MAGSKASNTAKKAASSTAPEEISSDDTVPTVSEDEPGGGTVESVDEASFPPEEPLDTPVEPEPVPEAFALVDPAPMSPEDEPGDGQPPYVPPMVTVVAVRNEASVMVGEAHYSLRAGTTLTVQQHVADELVNRKLVRAL